jgi:galactose-1-phosphate uridylyltransferase
MIKIIKITDIMMISQNAADRNIIEVIKGRTTITMMEIDKISIDIIIKIVMITQGNDIDCNMNYIYFIYDRQKDILFKHYYIFMMEII